MSSFTLTKEVYGALVEHQQTGTTGWSLEPGCWWEVLGTLLHEQLHFWQKLNGRPSKPGPGNYHNVQYRDRARRLGLDVSSRGVNEAYDPEGPFMKLLVETGVVSPSVL